MFDPEKHASDKALSIFFNMAAMYQSLWVRSYGDEPDKDFCSFADSLSDECVARILEHCKERLANGIDFPPELAALQVLRSTPTTFELHNAKHRVMHGNPEGIIEEWIASRYGFNLKRMSTKDLDKQFKSFMMQAIELNRKGELFAEEKELLKLSVHSTKNLNDIKREEYENSGAYNPFAERIQNIIKNKKRQ